MGAPQDGAAVGRIALADGGFTLVDADVFAAVGHLTWKAPANKGKRYAIAWLNGQRITLHHYVQPVLHGQVRDHVNGDSLDNRRANLRACSVKENHKNRRRYRTNTTGFKGVIARGAQFRAVIMVDGQQIALGGYPCAVQAAVAYDRAAKAHFGEFSSLNFSPDRDWILPEPVRSAHSEKMGRSFASTTHRKRI